MRVQKPALFDQLSTKGRHSSTSCRRGKSYPSSLVLFLLPHVAVDYCASCSDFCLYLIAAIDHFGIATCLEIERAYHGLAGVAKLSAAPCYVHRRFTNLRVRILFTAYIGLASHGRVRNIENETVFVPAHFNGCLVNRVLVLWLWRRYVKIGAFKDNERFSRFRGCTGLRRCRGTYAGGEK